MIKLNCKVCGETWYTSNTKPNQKCHECGGLLVEDNSFISIDSKSNDTLKTTCKPKVVFLDDYCNINT